jgi:hypothetical protein
LENIGKVAAVPLTSEAASVSSVGNVAQRQELVQFKEEQVTVNNTFQFASVPVKAGYFFLNQKFKLKLNAGLMANFYLGNVMNEDNNQFARFEFSPGDASPYREVSFSGLTSVSLGYQILEQVNFMLEPNYTQALHPFTKDQTNFQTNPAGFGIMAGIRYDF